MINLKYTYLLDVIDLQKKKKSFTSQFFAMFDSSLSLFDLTRKETGNKKQKIFEEGFINTGKAFSVI